MSPKILKQALWILLGYLCGSVSFAYLVGRVGRAMDLRRYGSRKLSASNVYTFLGFGGMALAGILDIAKAALPTWLALRLGHGLAVAVGAGLAAMVGHNWPLFFGFKGGRGISTALGLLLCVFPWGALWILGWVAAGRLMPHAAAAPALLGFISLPFFAASLGQPSATVWACLGMLLLTIIKRLEGNRQPIPPQEGTWRVLWRRLVLDRDIADFEAWIHHRPNASEQAH
jgi:glycerol-3-phosphate acyltransferase PlsY